MPYRLHAIECVSRCVEDAFQGRQDLFDDRAVFANGVIHFCDTFVLLISLHFGKVSLADNTIVLYINETCSCRLLSCRAVCGHHCAHQSGSHLMKNMEHTVRDFICQSVTDVLDGDVSAHGHLADRRVKFARWHEVLKFVDFALSILSHGH